MSARPSEPVAVRSPRAPWVHLALVALVAIATYIGTLGFDLVYDDREIVESPLLAHPWDLSAIWRNEYYPEAKGDLGLYRPLSQWSYLANFDVLARFFDTGPHPLGLHAVNIALFAGACCLLLAWLRQLQLPGFVALAAALVFAAHPIHSEAVANVTGRSEILALLFGLVFLIGHRRGHRIAAALAYLLAMWSKESAIAFWPVALAMDRLMPAVKRRISLVSHAAYAAVMIAWLGLRAAALSETPTSLPFVDNPLAFMPAGERVLNAAAIQIEYLRLLLVPIGLSADHAYDQVPLVVSALDLRILGFAALIAAASFLGWRLRERRAEIPFALLGYAILFATTSNFLLAIGTNMAERLVFAPSLFVCLLAALAMGEIDRRVSRVIARVATGVLVIALATLAALQSRVWTDELTLVRAQVASAPRSAKAHLNLANALSGAGDPRAAIPEFEAAIAIHREYAWAHLWLGDALARAGQRERAVEVYREAIRISAGFVEAHVALAGLLLDLGRRSEAAPLATGVVALDPECDALPALQRRLLATCVPEERARSAADLARGRDRGRAGDAAGAIEALQRAVAPWCLSESERVEALELLADAYEKQGRKKRAEAYRQAAQAALTR